MQALVDNAAKEQPHQGVDRSDSRAARDRELRRMREREERARAVAPSTFFRIAELWSLSDGEQEALLGLRNRSELRELRDEPTGVNLPNDVLMRISHIVGIFEALQNLLPDHEEADGWVKRPNKAHLFGRSGKSTPLGMMSGQMKDLAFVRQCLDGQRGVWV